LSELSEDLSPASHETAYEPAAKTALAAGLVGLLLLFPFGPLLGPMALWSGLTARRRIQAAGGKMAGSGVAMAGIVIGAIVCALSVSMVIAEVATFMLTGGLIPAP
jgi:uncharacterized Tic20 family protein